MESPLSLSIITGIPIPVVLIERTLRVAAMNELARGLFGEENLGRHFVLTFRQPQFAQAMSALFETGESQECSYILSNHSGDTTFSVSLSPLEDQTLLGAVVSFKDVTENEKISQMRRDFVANLSHELRSPLTALMGFIETLRGPACQDEKIRDRFLGIMQHEAERMNRLVQDLLFLSRVEATERVRPTELVDAHAVIMSVIRALNPLSRKMKITVEMIGLPAPVLLPADPDQLSQIFTNLIENAIKYGKEGGSVHVNITAIDRDSQLRGPVYRMDVQDDGAGIDPIYLPRLTERFFRIDDHRSREKGGTGLWLAIVKHIIYRHRGRLLIDSTLSKGSCFSAILPKE
jgi:two-component system phosphate regulon sensor histidine kinase PhoR